LSQAVIGILVVALGTSLPELATSAVAAYKGNADMAVGNIVGSNIFNVFFVLGISASIQPIAFSPALNTDILFKSHEQIRKEKKEESEVY
jgi:cation:H+ antiporter